MFFFICEIPFFDLNFIFLVCILEYVFQKSHMGCVVSGFFYVQIF